MANPDAWEPHAADFLAHYDSLYGRVRTHVVHQHLLAHLPPAPATIVDIGGGAGTQSIPLAELGYDVTIVDPSPAMLDAARATGAPVKLVQATGLEAPAILGRQRFDAVLCHGVLMYIESPEPFESALVSLLTPGGVLSIITTNSRLLALRPAYMGAWREALAAFDASRTRNGLGVVTRGDTVEGLSARLSSLRVDPVAWYGVRLFVETWGRDRPPHDDDEEVFAVELEASRRDPYRQMSRLFHLVGVRR